MNPKRHHPACGSPATQVSRGPLIFCEIIPRLSSALSLSGLSPEFILRNSPPSVVGSFALHALLKSVSHSGHGGGSIDHREHREDFGFSPWSLCARLCALCVNLYLSNIDWINHCGHERCLERSPITNYTSIPPFFPLQWPEGRCKQVRSSGCGNHGLSGERCLMIFVQTTDAPKGHPCPGVAAKKLAITP